MALYYVCRSYEVGSVLVGKPKIVFEAVRIRDRNSIDFLSCEAIVPILQIEARNKKDAIKRFRERVGV
jgi:hypothetical protein